jgi:quercetin dioxygenase-like cupin family protein
LTPGVAIKVLRKDSKANNQTILVRMLPGSGLRAHSHTQDEECLVLQGEIFIGTHRLGSGDMHFALAHVDHDAVVSPRGALLLVRAEIPDPHSFA